MVEHVDIRSAFLLRFTEYEQCVDWRWYWYPNFYFPSRGTLLADAATFNLVKTCHYFCQLSAITTTTAITTAV